MEMWMKRKLVLLVGFVASCLFANPVSAFSVVTDGDAYNFAKNIPTPTFNILYDKASISKPGAVFSKTNGSLFNTGMSEDTGGNQIFGVQLPFSALPNHINALYTLKSGDNPISGSYSFLLPNSVRDNYGDYYDLRISESNIKIGSRVERGVRSSDYVTLFSANRALVSRSTGGNYSARNGLGQQGDFTISVEKNGTPVEGTFIFSARDFDVPDHVTEHVTAPYYAGPYSESLQDVNSTISKVYLTNDSTIRVLNNNRLVGSTSNHDATYKSGFAFLANSTQVVHMGISGAATGVPLLLEHSFSSFEQTSGNGGTISATSRGDSYDSISGRLITIPSASDGSNAVVYTMTPDSCYKAKSVTLSTQTTSDNENISQIEVAELAEHPVDNLTFNEETGVLTYTYLNTDDHYRRYAIHVDWEEKANCPADAADQINPASPTDSSNGWTVSGGGRAIGKEIIPDEKASPNTGAVSNSEYNSGSTEAYWGTGIIGILLLLMGIRRRHVFRFRERHSRGASSRKI